MARRTVDVRIKDEGDFAMVVGATAKGKKFIAQQKLTMHPSALGTYEYAVINGSSQDAFAKRVERAGLSVELG